MHFAAVDCGEPNVVNALKYTLPIPNQWKFQDTAVVSCKPGYTISQDFNVIECTALGRWSTATCARKYGHKNDEYGELHDSLLHR